VHGLPSQIWQQTPQLESVRRSYFSGKPLPWNRVHNLGDFAYFDHAVHVQRGLGCVTCHGPVDHMARIEKMAPLSMQWCLDCHRKVEAETLRDPGVNIAELLGSDAPSEAQGTAQSTALASAAGEAPHQHYEPMHGQLYELEESKEYTRRGSVTSLTTCSACHR